jgi:hypothetical protein
MAGIEYHPTKTCPDHPEKFLVYDKNRNLFCNMRDCETFEKAPKAVEEGGPPGTKKNDAIDQIAVRAELGKLIAATPGLAPEPKVKRPFRKAMAWALKRFGAEGVYADGERNEKQAKHWALEQYEEYRAAKARKRAGTASFTDLGKITVAEGRAPTPNEATKALEEGAARKKARQTKKDAPQAPQVQQAPKVDPLTSIKASADAVVKQALEAFIDGPIKDVMQTFVTLYMSRKMDGGCDEAVLALDACRKAFDACGLILADVVTEKRKPSTVKTEPTKKESAPKPKKETAPKKAKAPKKDKK